MKVEQIYFSLVEHVFEFGPAAFQDEVIFRVCDWQQPAEDHCYTFSLTGPHLLWVVNRYSAIKSDEVGIGNHCAFSYEDLPA